MSLQSWMDEFYDRKAELFDGSDDVRGAVEHSLKKWEGTLSKCLKKHNCKYDNETNCVVGLEKEEAVKRFHRIENYEDWMVMNIRKASEKKFCFNGATCALCETSSPDSCISCILYIMRGGI
jgi:hypothetical protein